jgi:hypothetical protein
MSLGAVEVTVLVLAFLGILGVLIIVLLRGWLLGKKG